MRFVSDQCQTKFILAIGDAANEFGIQKTDHTHIP